MKRDHPPSTAMEGALDNLWLALARHTPMAILTDLDGTLIPFADRPEEARVPRELAMLLQTLASDSGCQVAVVSGRRRESLEAFFQSSPSVWLIAEHGGWRRDEGAWTKSVPIEAGDLRDLATELEPVVGRVPGALLEPKTLSLALHYRLVSPRDEDALLVEVTEVIERWISANPGYEQLEGSRVLEIRSSRNRKSLAVPWLRERAGSGARLIVLGDDVTDEDMFRELGAQDEGILVGRNPSRMTAAHWRLPGPNEAIEFLQWIASARRADPTPRLASAPCPIHVGAARRSRPPGRLLAVSNRLPELRIPTGPSEKRERNVGGLVSALEPVLRKRDGMWLGWSGRADATRLNEHPGMDDQASPQLAWIDFTPDLHRHYYSGFCNRSLWPLFHTFPARVRFTDEEWSAYERANSLFAAAATELVQRDAPVWAHDYHLMLMAADMKRRGHRGPIGLFLHVPFPAPDLFRMIPWSARLLEDLLSFDLLGFHTANDVSNFLQTVGALSPARVGDDVVHHRGRRIRVRVFPIGILPEAFSGEARGPEFEEADRMVRTVLPQRRLILGVDRLDYTKGIPQRLDAFARLLHVHPEWRGTVSMVQVSVPSRSDVPEYRDQRKTIEETVSRINREFAGADWIPVQYFYRSFAPDQLVHLYRNACVAMVTPLRDGMNLVAKEFIAAQHGARPGVLLLSQFAGAAVELADGLLTNPYYVDGMARDLDRALRMSLDERIRRHSRLLAAVQRTTALTWAEDYVTALEQCRGG